MSDLLSGIGQDSHAFGEDDKPLVLGGCTIPHFPGLRGNSDADVILHALCNAISSITGEPFLGAKTDAMCQAGITDSAQYVQAQLDQAPIQLRHISISLEAKKPKLEQWIPAIRSKVAAITGLMPGQVGLTATSGESLSAFGRGEGIMATVIISASRIEPAHALIPKASADDQALTVLVSCPDGECADTLAHGLVELRYAACAQQLPIKSVYRWQGHIEHQNEILLLIKTRQQLYQALEHWVTQHHPYEVPQITVLRLDTALPSYLAWLVEQTSPP